MEVTKKLPIQLQILNEFIWEKPQLVVDILKKNGIKVSGKPTLPEITRKSVQAVTDENQRFIDDIDLAIKTQGESGFVFTTALAVSTLISIGGAILGASQAKKQRKAALNIKLMELATNEKLTYANIQAMKEQSRIEILTNTILEYGKALQSESTQRQKDTSLFIGIMGVGLAVVYAAIQIFKK
jgi:hypothetical protein